MKGIQRLFGSNTFYLCVFMVIFILIKIEHLTLPFYWDEAWSYARSVYAMYKGNITLNPVSVDPEVFRGHPLLFYFLTSGIAKLIGFSARNMHIIMMCCSLAGLLLFYRSMVQIAGLRPAFISVSILIFQEVFMVQSSMLLPEVMLAFLSWMVLVSFYQEKWLAFTLWGMAVVMTKESGIIAPLICFIMSVFGMFQQQSSPAKKLVRIAITALPLLLMTVFMLTQYAYRGWFLFPEHTGLIQWNPEQMLARTLESLRFVLLAQNRNVLLVLLFVCIIYRIVSKHQVSNQSQYRFNTGFPILLIIFFIVYLAFTVINFYSTRYLMALFPVWAALFGLLIDKFPLSFLSPRILSSLLGMLFIYYFLYFRQQGFGDISGNSTQVILTQKNTIKKILGYAGEQRVGGDFLMYMNLSYPELGYVPQNNSLNIVAPAEADLVFSTCIEPLDYIVSGEQAKFYKLLWEERQGDAWCRVYRRNNPD